MKTILVIREPDEFSLLLTKNDFTVINLPLVETKPLENLSDFEAKLPTINDYDGIFLTSKTATGILADKFCEQNIKFAGKVYVLGKRSFEILKNKNLDLFFDETANTAREMLEKIAPEDLKNKIFLFVRGEKSLGTITEFLADAAKVDETIVYETRQIPIKIDKIKEIRKRLKKGEIAAACFFSPSAADLFLEQFGTEILHQTRIATIGKTTAEFFEQQNFKVNFVSPKSNAKDFAVELIGYLRNGNEK